MPSEPPTPPVPLSAVFHTGVNELFLTFDKALNPGPVNNANWSARLNNRRKNAPQAIIPAVPPFTRLDLINWPLGLVEAGPDVLDYKPPPFDVVGTATGLPVVAFADFPVTVLP